MIFVLVELGADVIEKLAFSGDDVATRQIVSRLKLENPSLVYQESDEATFNAAVIKPIKTQVQLDWDAAKLQGVQKQLDFLGKKVGLE